MIWIEAFSLFPSFPFQQREFFLHPLPRMKSHLWYFSLFPHVRNRTISAPNLVVSPSHSLNIDNYARSWEGPEGIGLPSILQEN